MKVAALDDIHGNLPPLEAVLAEIESEHFDLAVVGADVFSGTRGRPVRLPCAQPWPARAVRARKPRRETFGRDPAVRVREHAFPRAPSLLAHALGSTQVFPNGKVLVGWDTEPYFTEHAEDGAVRFDATLPQGGENDRTLRFPWTGRPIEPLALAARGSWSDAVCELERRDRIRRLAAARRIERRRPAARREKTPARIETTLAAPGGASHVAVAALAAGKTLGRSTMLLFPAMSSGVPPAP